MKLQRSLLGIGLVILFAVPPSGADCGWFYIETLDPDDCTWDGTTLTCPFGWEFQCYGWDGGTNTSGGSSSGSGTGGTVVNGNGTAPPNVFQENRLSHGMVIALTKLQQASCSGMWPELGLISDGPTLLQLTTYRDGSNTARCLQLDMPNAWMYQGSLTVNLCRRFGFRSYEDSALTLIHEALHAGGLTEYPSDPDAMTSNQISTLVHLRCPC